jgi:hypothetical protein
MVYIRAESLRMQKANKKAMIVLPPFYRPTARVMGWVSFSLEDILPENDSAEKTSYK